MIGEVFNLARWEWFRLSRRSAFRVSAALALLTLPAALLTLPAARAAATLLDDQALLPGTELNYFAILPYISIGLAPLLAIVLAAFLHAGDLSGGHARTLAARGAARGAILAAKLLTAALLLLAWHLAAILLAALFSLAWTTGFANSSAGLIDTAAAVQNALLYLALGVLLSHWRQSTAFTIGVGLGLISFEAIAYPIAEWIGETLDWPLADFTAWTIRGVARGLRGEGEIIARAWYIPITAGYAILFTAAAYALFRQSDLRAGGE